MFAGGIAHDTSTHEGLAAKARALHLQMDAAQKSGAHVSSDTLTHIQMRDLRREAKATLYHLEDASSMPNPDSYALISVPREAAPGADASAPVVYERKNAKLVFDDLKKKFNATDFIKNNGKSIYQHRPRNLPMVIKIAEQSKDIVAKTMSYGRKRPVQFAVISISILVLKVLFVLFVWNALVEGSKHLLGIKAKSKDDKQQRQNVPAVLTAQVQPSPTALVSNVSS